MPEQPPVINFATGASTRSSTLTVFDTIHQARKVTAGIQGRSPTVGRLTLALCAVAAAHGPDYPEVLRRLHQATDINQHTDIYEAILAAIAAVGEARCRA